MWETWSLKNAKPAIVALKLRWSKEIQSYYASFRGRFLDTYTYWKRIYNSKFLFPACDNSPSYSNLRNLSPKVTKSDNCRRCQTFEVTWVDLTKTVELWGFLQQSNWFLKTQHTQSIAKRCLVPSNHVRRDDGVVGEVSKDDLLQLLHLNGIL